MDTITRMLAAIPRSVVRVVMALAILSALAAAAALVNPQWIEDVLGGSPDGGSGEAEIGLALVPAVVALVLVALAVAATVAARTVRAGEGGDEVTGASGARP